MGIVVLLLLLWHVRLHPSEFGSVGTNVFGSATLGLLSGSNNESPPSQGVEIGPVKTNAPPAVAPSNPAPTNHAPPGSHQALSTNLLNTNGPVTEIAVAPGDVVVTPPGVTSAANVAEAATIEKRLGEASARGGDIQFSLSWNNYNDLDLHCVEPGGEEIWYSHPISSRTSGELDVDRNAHAPYTTTPVENIYWPVGAAPRGIYRIFVVYYSPRNGMDPTVPTAFTVRTVVRGWKTFFFKSTISYTGRLEPKLICKLLYDPDNPDPAKRFAFVP